MALSHQFPTLTVDQIVVFCKEVEIPLTKNDIKKPEVQRWNMLYGVILEIVLGVPPDQVRQQQIHSSEMSDYPDLHEDSTSLISFTLALQRMMYACAFTDFNIKDITDPEPKRLIKIMSAIINFYRFRQSRIEVFEALKEKNERYREQREYVLKTNDELKQRINKLKAKRAEQDPEVKKIQDDIDKMSKQVCENQKVQEDVSKTIAELKKNIAEKRSTQDRLKLAILNSQQEGDKLSQKIVSSPERVLQEQNRMEQKLAGLKMSLDEKRTLGLTLQTQHKKVKERKACAEKGLKLLESIKQEVDKEDEAVEQIRGCSDRQQELQQTLVELTAKEDQMKRVLARRQEKRTKLNMQHQAKMTAFNDQLAELNGQIKVMSKGRDEEKHKLLLAKQEILSELQDEEKVVASRVENVHMLYSGIVDQVDAMHAKLGRNWDFFRQLLKSSLAEYD